VRYLPLLGAAAAAAGLIVPLAAGVRDPLPEAPRAPLVLLASEPATGAARPAARVPAGSRILLVPLDGRGPARTLAEGFAAAGSPRASIDGRSVLFAGREREGDRDGIWVTGAGGEEPRRVASSGEGDCSAPDWLPDGRVVFAAPAPGFRGLRPAACRALFAAPASGEGAPERLTYFPGGEDADPCVLADGRVLFARASGEGDRLLAVHADGTGIHAFHGPGLPCLPRRRPREAPDRSVWYAGGPAPAGALRVDARRPDREAVPAAGVPEGEVRAVEPLPDGGLLVSLRPAAGRSTFGVLLLRPGGPAAGVPVLDDPGRDEVDPVLLAPRARPQGHLSLVKPGTAAGRVYCVDARRVNGPRRIGAASVRLHEALPPAEPGLLGEAEERLLGTVPLEADGSFYAEVPADRPLRIEALNPAGDPVLGSGCVLWVRPNEIRACVGCHEDPAAAPPNALPAAVLGEPAALARPDRSWRPR
jgi:hypothetical protein